MFILSIIGMSVIERYVIICYNLFVIKKITRHYLARRTSSLQVMPFFLCKEDKLWINMKLLSLKTMNLKWM